MSGTIWSATRAVHLIHVEPVLIAASISGVTRPIAHIASAKMPDRNGVENDEKKIAIAATVSTSTHASTIASITGTETATCCHASIAIIATANSATSTVSTSAMPRYLPTTNSQR